MNYFTKLESLGEIIIIDDHSDDVYDNIVSQFTPDFKIILIRNEYKKGAPASRNIGLSKCSFEYVLFCDDDIIVPPDYGRKCMESIVQGGHPCVSGRITYLEENQTLDDASKAFGKGYKRERFDLETISIDHCAFAEDGEVPFTHAVFMWKLGVIKRIGFDERLGYGNGYFEEVTPQISLLKYGMKPYLTNNTISFHLPYSFIKGGGNTQTDFIRWKTAIKNGIIVYKEYFPLLQNEYKISNYRWMCFAKFVFKQTKKQMVVPKYIRLRTLIIESVKRFLGI